MIYNIIRYFCTLQSVSESILCKSMRMCSLMVTGFPYNNNFVLSLQFFTSNVLHVDLNVRSLVLE